MFNRYLCRSGSGPVLCRTSRLREDGGVKDKDLEGGSRVAGPSENGTNQRYIYPVHQSNQPQEGGTTKRGRSTRGRGPGNVDGRCEDRAPEEWTVGARTGSRKRDRSGERPRGTDLSSSEGLKGRTESVDNGGAPGRDGWTLCSTDRQGTERQ